MPGLSQWSLLVGDVADGDLIAITDINDTSQSLNGSSRKITLSQLLSSISKRLQNVSAGSGTIQLECSLYHTFVITITGVATIQFDNLDIGAVVNVIITNGGAYTVTWPAEVDWPDATAPDLSAAGRDRLVFQKLSAGIIDGSVAGQLYG